MSPLTRTFLLYLTSLKHGKDEATIKAAAALVTHFYVEPAAVGDSTDAAIRKIIDASDADSAFEALAKLIVP